MALKIILATILLALLCSGAAHAQQPTIAVIGPKTGRLAYMAEEMFQAMHYSVDELNRQGGLLGRQVRLMEIDNKSTPEGSAEAARQAVEQNVDCVIGPMVSSLAIIQAEILQRAGIPMLTPSATAPPVTQVGNYIFRTTFTDTFQGHALAHFAGRQLNARKAAILAQKDEVYCRSLATAFKDSLKAYDGSIVFTGEYTAGQEDYGELLHKALQSGMDALFIPGYTKEAAHIIDQARELGFTGPIIGGDGWSKRIPSFIKNLKHMQNCFEIRHFYRNSGNDVTRRFLKGYEERHGTMVQDLPALAYDALLAYAEAVKQARSFDRAKVRDALSRVSFQGATGTISFDANGDPKKPAMIITYKGGTPQYFMVLEP